jgi:hypothetical protein
MDLTWAAMMGWGLQPVFVVGGGPSLSSFSHWDWVKRGRAIGCNDAYLLGPKVIDLLFFGDPDWVRYHKDSLRSFPNPIATNSAKVAKMDLPFTVHVLPRAKRGFHTDAIGWNGNTGISAINLALCLGAKQIYLLGFDMQLDEQGRSNWHPNNLTHPTPAHYERYLEQAEHCKWKKKWPGASILNLNPQSRLGVFEKAAWEEVFGYEQAPV